MTESKEITLAQEIQKSLAEVRDRIENALPQMLDPDRFMEISVGLIRTTPALVNCAPGSLKLAIYGIARLGLMPDPTLGHVYVVPFKNRATVVPGYRGMIELARRSGVVGSVHTGVVYPGDEFDWWIDENGPRLKHKPVTPDERKSDTPTHVYCVASIGRNGDRQVEVMSWAEIEAVRKKAKTSNVWNEHTIEMARKTVVRRASKYWPQDPEGRLGLAVEMDETAERGARQPISTQFDDEAHPPAVDAAEDALLDDDDSIADAEFTSVEGDDF